MTGQKFGRLTAMVPRGLKWLFSCECGTIKEINSKNVRRGLVRSCGCLRSESAVAMGRGNRTHGQAAAETPEYRAWRSAIDRCRNPDHPAFPGYGARGISVCHRWQVFENFFLDMGPRPSPAHSLDRFPDNDGGYEPGNCRWATKKEQARNRRSTHWVEVDGERVSLAAAIENKGLKSSLVRQRLATGWSEDRALT